MLVSCSCKTFVQKQNLYSMKTKITYSLLLAITFTVAGSIFITGCKKDGDKTEGATKVQIKMTDAPGNFEEINLDVKQIILIGEDGDSYAFASKVSIFDILDYRLGTANPDILVAEGEMPSGDITEIRLVLGNGNTIKIDGQTSSLTTPSAQSSGFKVKLTENPKLLPGVTYTLLLDFDAAKSIVKTGNGKHILKPVVRGIVAATSGFISGTALPLAAHPEVLVINGTDTVGTLADPVSGKLTIGGLRAGKYQVKMVPVAGYRDSTINNVNVNVGQNTVIEPVVLKAQ